MKKTITVIGQCYNEEEMLPIYYNEMCKLMDKMNYVHFELLFIDDNSKDKSLKIIKDLSKRDKRVKYISMSKNFGREACAMAGFKHATGDFITTMDLDLQDPPDLLIQMYDAIVKEGYDIAAAKALTRKGYSKIHKLCINIFYKITNGISTVKMIDGQREYRLMTRQAVNAILEYTEYNLFNKGLLNDIGFNIKWIEYENVERVAGTTKFPYKRMIKYAITGIIDYSTFPLMFILYLGIFLFISSFILFIITTVFALTNVSVNFTIMILSTVLLLLFGIQMIGMGIMSLYLAQIHLEVKNRPIYIIKEQNINTKNKGD